MSNPTGKGGFQDRKHHINKNGRPRSFDALRKMAQEMFIRPALDAGGEPVKIDGKPASIVEVVVWKMIHSKNPKEVELALQIAFGKVPDNMELNQKGEIIIKVIRE